MKLAALFLAVFALSANASEYNFNCKTKAEGKNVTIKFIMTDLYGKAVLEDYPGEENDNQVKVTPISSAIYDLNQNLSYGVGKEKLAISGDSDGVFYVDLVLYRNSGFTKGYVAAKGEVKFYSPVNCTVKKN